MIEEVAPLQGRRILIVEDDYFVAQALIALLEDQGAEILGPVGWVEEAIAFIETNHHRIDNAVLDVNLHGQKSYPIADALVRHSIRFIFATGYSGSALDYPYRGHPRCDKPFMQSALIEALIQPQVGKG